MSKAWKKVGETYGRDKKTQALPFVLNNVMSILPDDWGL